VKTWPIPTDVLNEAKRLNVLNDLNRLSYSCGARHRFSLDHLFCLKN